MRTLLLAAVVALAGLCLASDVQAGGFGCRGVGCNNGFGVRGVRGNVGFGGGVFIQNTTRGPFGRVRSQTTIVR